MGCILYHGSQALRRQYPSTPSDDLTVRFLNLCDLAVAYDMTGESKYLDACRRWSSRIIACQSEMVRRGAYYMNHSRAPGQDRGQWNVADSGSIAMGVLATAIRCEDPADKARYLDSVKAFAKLVMDNYVGPQGGISNGLWPAYDGQWWCSTATFGTLAFVLHEETGEEKYLKVASGALDWMIDQDFREVKPITFQQRPSGIIFYCFELYSSGLRHLKSGSRQYERAMRQIDFALGWMVKNQKTRGAKVPNYLQRNVNMAGLPYLMCVMVGISEVPHQTGTTTTLPSTQTAKPRNLAPGCIEREAGYTLFVSRLLRGGNDRHQAGK